MRNNKKIWTSIIASLGLIILILDTKTALAGAKDGISLCLNSVIPSLFPFFILSTLIAASLTGNPVRTLRPIGKLCGIPEGAESLLLLGLLGGYPVGAQSINDAYRNKCIKNDDAHRLLGFCSNAGPAFIFGMIGGLFADKKALWALWFIHILSALIVGCILPRNRPSHCKLPSCSIISIPAALEISIRTMANVCGWVILFRALLAFLQRWILWFFPTELQVMVAGLLELSNGCHTLYAVTNPGIRFVFSSCFLSFGGMCVAMQTISATRDIGTGLYFPGKLLQCAVSFLVSYISQHHLFSTDEIWKIPCAFLVVPACFLFILPIYLNRKKVVAIPC